MTTATYTPNVLVAQGDFVAMGQESNSAEMEARRRRQSTGRKCRYGVNKSTGRCLKRRRSRR